MKILDEGHAFELESLDGDWTQQLLFVKREGKHYPGNIGSHPGTTMQEVLRALISRADYVNQQIPCLETEVGINAMKTALIMFEMRAKRVKLKQLKENTIDAVLKAVVCTVCGHVSCTEQHNAPA